MACRVRFFAPYLLKFNFPLSTNLWVNFGALNDAPYNFGETLQKQIYEKDLSPYSLIALSHKYTLDKMQKIVNNVNERAGQVPACPIKSPYFVDLRVNIIIKSNINSFALIAIINSTTSFHRLIYRIFCPLEAR